MAEKKDTISIEIQPKMVIAGLLVIVFIASLVTHGFDSSYSGGVTITGLVDGKCNDCYPVSLHKDILVSQYGVNVDQMNVIDVNSAQGQALVKKYNIIYVPTVIISSGLKKYEIASLWSQLGTVEGGNYIFRSTESMKNFGVFENIVTGQEIMPYVTLMPLSGFSSCGTNSTLDMKVFMSSTCANCSSEISIIDKLKGEFGSALNVTYVAAPTYRVNNDGSVNSTDISETMKLSWFSIPWSESQSILKNYSSIFQGSEKTDNETGYTVVPATPFFILNCNELRPAYLLPKELIGRYPNGTEMSDLRNDICEKLPGNPNCKA